MRNKRWVIRGLVGAALAALVVVGVVGCWWLINVAPAASFTVSALSGTAPLTVNFSGILSSDEDGTIKKYEWDFGDGGSAVGEAVSHTFNTAGSFPVVLRVTDDDGATDTATQTIVVLPAEEPGGGTGTGPTVSFTSTPLTGQVPLTVTFNASATTYPGHSLTSYTWNFGDATTGTGITTTHIYGTAGTYAVVLTVIASDNTSRTANQSIIATSVPVTPPSGGPTARFTANKTDFVGPDVVTFDPGSSTASTGRTLTSFIWSFGIAGATETKSSDGTVNYTYWTGQTSQNFTVTLTVIDDAGGTNSFSRAIIVRNLLPVAGFSVEFVPDGRLGKKYPTEAVPLELKPPTPPGLPWLVGTPIPVTFESLDPTPNGGRFWNSVDPLHKGAAAPDGINESTSVRPGNYNVTNKNLSYDGEGQSHEDDGWGIVSYYIDFGDGTSADSNPAVKNPGGGFTSFVHVYTKTGAAFDTFVITLTVRDERGGTGTLKRAIRIYQNP